MVRQFQEDPETTLFLISLKAGGVGLNLTAADYVFLFDPWWNEAVEKQAIDRAHRVGRTQQVIARRYVVSNSIEEKMMRLKEHKSSLAASILDLDGRIEDLTLEDLLQLLT
jgi:SNF2 family DNA or RNA helicase